MKVTRNLYFSLVAIATLVAGNIKAQNCFDMTDLGNIEKIACIDYLAFHTNSKREFDYFPQKTLCGFIIPFFRPSRNRFCKKSVSS